MTLARPFAAIAILLFAAHCALRAAAQTLPVVREIRIEQMDPALPDIDFVRDYLQGQETTSP